MAPHRPPPENLRPAGRPDYLPSRPLIAKICKFFLTYLLLSEEVTQTSPTFAPHPAQLNCDLARTFVLVCGTYSY